jgi:hypothetical protein
LDGCSKTFLQSDTFQLSVAPAFLFGDYLYGGFFSVVLGGTRDGGNGGSSVVAVDEPNASMFCPGGLLFLRFPQLCDPSYFTPFWTTHAVGLDGNNGIELHTLLSCSDDRCYYFAKQKQVIEPLRTTIVQPDLTKSN